MRIIDVGNNQWSLDLVDSMPSLQAISGCDAVSVFNGIDKAKRISAGEKREEYLDAMKFLGETLDISRNTFGAIYQIICKLYGIPEEVNIVRYKTFFRNKSPEPKQLPPTKK